MKDVLYRLLRTFGLVLVLLTFPGFVAAQELAGLVVEEVPPGGSLAEAGILAGDRLVSWSASAPSGKLDSVFDWWALANGTAWTSSIEVQGERNGEAVTFQIHRGDWSARLRPHLSAELEEVLRTLEGRDPCTKEAGDGGWGRFRQRLLSQRGDRSELAAWTTLRHEEFRARCPNSTIDWVSLKATTNLLLDPARQMAFWAILGRAYLDLKNPTLALELFQRSQDMSKSESPSLSRASVTYLLGTALLDQENLSTSLSLRNDSLARVRELAPGSLLEARILWDLGHIRRLQGALEASRQHYRDCLRVIETLQVAPGELAKIWRNLGIVRAQQGNLKDAQLHLERSLALAEGVANSHALLSTILNNLGLVAYFRGDLDLAQRHLLEAQRHEKAAPGGARKSPSNLLNLGLVATEREDYGSAEGFFGRALEIQRQQAPESLGMATILNNMGRVKRLRGATAEARRHHLQALEIQRQIAPSSLAVAESLERLAQVDEMEGRLDAAAAGYQNAQSLRESLAPSSTRQATLLYRMAQLALKRGRLASSGTLFRKAVTLVEERLEDLGGSHEQRQKYQSIFGPLFRDYIEVLVEDNHSDTAFELQERSRARIFREMLVERDLDLGSTMPPGWESERELLASRYDEISIEIASLGDRLDSEKSRRLDLQLAEVRWRREELLEKLRQHSPRLAALNYPRTLGLEEIQAALDPGTLLLAFSVNEGYTLAFALSRKEGLQVQRIPLSQARLRQEVSGILSSIEQGAAFGSRQASRRAASLKVAGKRLFDHLLKPFEDRIDRAQRLLLLPDGPLYQLPFAVLVRESPPGEISDRGWQYLVEWKPVHFALSASLYADLRKPRSTPPADWPLVAFGAPAFPKAGSLGRPQMGADPELSSLVRQGFDFRPLPAARGEVERIAALFPGSRAYVGDQVTEERVRDLPPRLGLLHFATHVRLDEKYPLDSALVLSIPEHWGEGQANGLLQVWEIFESLRVDAEMVVLSACQSALGKEVQGEGLIGLTRAFHFAGARSVVASLWPVADGATAELMVRFYHFLRLGRSKDEALRAAQMELLSGSLGAELEAPYFWAAFQLNGDWNSGAEH